MFKIWNINGVIFICFIISVIFFLSVLIYFYKEKIKKGYYELFNPERLVKVIIHFPNNLYTIHWFLIPLENLFRINGIRYIWNSDLAEKNKSCIPLDNIDNKNNSKFKKYFLIDNKKYDFNKVFGIRTRWDKHIEIHYLYGIPNPITYTASKEMMAKIDINSYDLEKIKEDDLVNKLLALETEKNLLTIAIFIGIIIIIGIGLLFAQNMGLFDKSA